MLRAVLYARVSDESQVDTWSIPAQKHEYRDLCLKKDLADVNIYCEEGRSAHSDSIEKRPQFKRLLEDCNKRTFDVVVVHSLDRWSRNLRVTLDSFKQLADTGIAFISITENIDYSTPEGKLFIAMIGAFAQYFSDSLSKHTSKGLKERALNGLPNGDIPFGYKRDEDGKIYLVPDEAEAIKQIFLMYSTGENHLADLATWLNKRGLRTRNKHGIIDGSGNTVKGPRQFTLYSVRWLLHNPFFTGKISYKNEILPGKHESIVDEALFYQVQEKLKQAKSNNRSISTSFRPYLLKGIGRCIYCGYPLWCETNANGYSLYREKGGAHPDSNCPVGEKSIRCDVIDEQVSQLISSVVLDPLWREKIMDKISTKTEQDQIINERKNVNDKLRRLSKTYVDGLIEDGEYELQKKLLQDKLATLVIPELDAAMDAGNILENLRVVWENATLEEKHKLLTIMLDAVYVDLLTSRTVVGILPKPVFYPLFEVLRQRPNSKITVFKPDNENDSNNNLVGMVETGES